MVFQIAVTLCSAVFVVSISVALHMKDAVTAPSTVTSTTATMNASFNMLPTAITASVTHHSASTLPPVTSSATTPSTVNLVASKNGSSIMEKKSTSPPTQTSITEKTGSNVASVTQHHVMPCEQQHEQQQHMHRQEEFKKRRSSGAKKREIDSFPGSIAAIPTVSASSPVTMMRMTAQAASSSGSKILSPQSVAAAMAHEDFDHRLKRDGEILLFITLRRVTVT